MNKEQFFTSIQGKTVTFCGIGRSHMPLIRLFQEKGALVSARDKRSLEELGDNGKALQEWGVQLILGENYLEDLREDIIFPHPGDEVPPAPAGGRPQARRRCHQRDGSVLPAVPLQDLRRHRQRRENHHPHLHHRRAAESPGQDRPPGGQHRQAPAAGD